MRPKRDHLYRQCGLDKCPCGVTSRNQRQSSVYRCSTFKFGRGPRLSPNQFTKSRMTVNLRDIDKPRTEEIVTTPIQYRIEEKLRVKGVEAVFTGEVIGYDNLKCGWFWGLVSQWLLKQRLGKSPIGFQTSKLYMFYCKSNDMFNDILDLATIRPSLTGKNRKITISAVSILGLTHIWLFCRVSSIPYVVQTNLLKSYRCQSYQQDVEKIRLFRQIWSVISKPIYNVATWPNDCWNHYVSHQKPLDPIVCTLNLFYYVLGPTRFATCVEFSGETIYKKLH